MRLHRCVLTVVSCGVTLCAACAVPGKPEAIVRGTVPAGLPGDRPVPVLVPVPAELALQAELTARVSVGGIAGGEVVLQPERADEAAGTPARAWFMWKSTPDQADKPIVLRITTPESGQKASKAYRIRYAEPVVEVNSIEGKPVLGYYHGKPDPRFKYPMTSYIHPLFGLDGEVLTDCSPGDHLHHRGLFWTWVRFEQNGKNLGETWVPKNIDVVPADLSIAAGPVFARITAGHEYIYRPKQASQPPDGANSGDRLFDEHVVCRVFETTSGGRAVDVDLTLTALQDGLQIGGQTELNKGYGGMTLRFSTQQQGRATQPRIVADARLIDRDTVNHLKARWVDWTGFFLGPDQNRLARRSGGALFVHPAHPPLPAEPPEWITRAYGPVGVAYPGLQMLEIPKDKPLRLRYRVWVHRGDAVEGGVKEEYAAYAADWKWKAE